jgi:hypothetical protein
MATLQVTNLQNTAATVTNVSLLADGSTTIVLNATGTNRTGGLRYNAGNLEVYTSGGVWVAAGGGSGTVTGVAGTLPIVSTGGTAPVLSINAATNATAGSMSAADKAKLDGAATIVSAVTGTLPITVATGTSTPVIAINAATAAAAGSIEIATLAEAATGTDATRASTPETAVPKDASGMTGAGILPSGTTAQRPGTPVAGMQRFNTSTGLEEVYSGSTLGWRSLKWDTLPPTQGNLTISANGPLVSGTYTDLTINAGITATVNGLVIIQALGNVTINGSVSGIGTGLPGGIIGTTIFATTATALSGSTGSSGQGSGGGLYTGTVSFGYGVGGSKQSPSVLSSGGGSAGQVSGFIGANVFSQGGAGGGSLIIRCLGTLTVSGASTINVSGASGLSSVNSGNGDAHGGGGGSGGLIYLEATNLSIAGSLTCNGGSGSNGVTVGGGTPPAGSGGGGGYVILASPNAITDTSSKSFTGGTAGAGNGSSGGSGGGFGGAGGGTSTAAAAGASGEFLTNYFL